MDRLIKILDIDGFKFLIERIKFCIVICLFYGKLGNFIFKKVSDLNYFKL